MRRDAAINRDRLLKAAEEVFAARGSAATLADVADAAQVGPATLYRRFASKDALVREVLTGFFQRLIGLAEEAERAPAQTCVDVFLQTVGVELAANGGLSAPVWGELAPQPLVEELRGRTAALLVRAKEAQAIRTDVTTADVTAAIWAIRGVIQSERNDPAHHGKELWRRHLRTILRGFHYTE